MIKEYFPDVEIIEGTSTAGIAHAAPVANKLKLPMGYVRGGHKTHGRGNQIEGIVRPGMKAVVVEDLISTGGSSLEVVDVLREAGCEVLGLVAIFTYGLDSSVKNFEDKNCKFVTLSNYNTLLEVALENGYIKDNELEKLRQWKKNPKDESWMIQ